MANGPDPVASAAAALHDHKASCWEPGCTACILLAAAWRQALRAASSTASVSGKPICPKCGTAGCLEDKALDW